jgi:hypothetical protein
MSKQREIVFTLQTDAWCVHNRLFNANFEENLNEYPVYIFGANVMTSSVSPAVQ